MIRSEIQQLVALGSFPASQQVNLEVIRRQQELLNLIRPPISDEEAERLLALFGPDDYFGLAWSVLHLVESSPSWPIHELLTNCANEWIARLKERARKGTSTT